MRVQERVRVLRARIRESVLPQPVDWREVFGDKILTLEVESRWAIKNCRVLEKFWRSWKEIDLRDCEGAI